MEKLTGQEEQAMQAIWKTGEANVKVLLDNIEDPKPPYTTLASTVKNLEKKKFISARLMGNTNFYNAVISEAEYKKRLMKGFVQDYFSNSFKDLVNFFVQQKQLSPDELKEILKMIDE
jgi:predicted transcriptional regulator